jgi:hypothetical protein
MGRVLLWLFGGVIVLMVIVKTIGSQQDAGRSGSSSSATATSSSSRTTTYGDLKRVAAAECERTNAGGEWSSRKYPGISLETFCNGVGNLVAIEAHKRDHPAQYPPGPAGPIGDLPVRGR